MATGFIQRFKGKISAIAISMVNGGMIYESVAEGLTAHAGGGQANGVPLSAMISRFTIVATIGDSATLPLAVPGASVTVINAATNSMNVFPDTGSTIDAGSANAASAVAGGKTATFFTTKVGAWHKQLSA